MTRGHGHNYGHERPTLSYEQIKDMMVSKREPFALWDDIHVDRYKPPDIVREPHRRQHKWWGDIGVRPWEQEEHPPWRSSRGPGMSPHRVSTSANAPFATYDNEPLNTTTRPMVIAPWERVEDLRIKSDLYKGAPLVGDPEALKRVHRLPWALFEDGNRHEKDCRVTETKYPVNQRNEIPWNQRTKPDVPQPPQKPIILEPASKSAPFATSYNKVVVKHGYRNPSAANNTQRLYQRCAKPETKPYYHAWPWTRDEWDYHSKFPKTSNSRLWKANVDFFRCGYGIDHQEPKSFPRDPKTFVWDPIPYAYEPAIKGSHQPAHKWYPKNHVDMPAAGDFGLVDYPLKLESYPRDPSTYVPFPVPYVYPP